MKEGGSQRILSTVLGALLLAVACRYLPLISGLGRDKELTEPTSTKVLTRYSGVAAGEVRHGNQIAMLHLARLDGARPRSTAGRDPWRFQDPPPRKPLPVTASTPPTQQPPPSAAPLPDAKSPELTLEYLGSFGPRDKKIAVLRDGKRIFNALEGDAIDGSFIVSRIGYESVEIRPVGLPGKPAKRLGLRRR